MALSVSRSTAEVAGRNGLRKVPVTGTRTDLTFIQNKDLRLSQKSARETQELPLTGGEGRSTLLHRRVQTSFKSFHKLL